MASLAGLLILGVLGAASRDLPGLEARVLELTNQERAKKGLPALALDVRARDAARGHSQEMARLGYAGHDSPTEGRRKPSDRIWLAGITSTTHGENVGLHSLSGLNAEELAGRMMKGWMESPHHRNNILSPKFSHLGVGGGLGLYQGLESVFLTQTFLGKPVSEARLRALGAPGGRLRYEISGASTGSGALIVYWKPRTETSFEDAGKGPGAFSHEFSLPGGFPGLEVLLGFKKERKIRDRTEFHFDFTDRFLVDTDRGVVTPSLPPSRDEGKGKAE